jgi:MFS family permease
VTGRAVPGSPEGNRISEASGAPTGANAASARESSWPSPRRAWYAVTLFSLALMINFLDRGIVTLLVPPIQHDLHLTDTQVSLLIGFAFVFFYLILGLPIARLVDTRSRRVIIGVGLTIWSLMTGVCGLARTFWQLFAARVGVGVGEACNGPATFSMLADLFPPQKLPRAISVLNFGFVAGTGFALVMGGTVLHFAAGLPPISLPGIGILRPWQITFMVVGLPGLLVALLFTTLEEPVRCGLIHGAAARALPVREVAGFLWENRRTYVPMFLGLALNVILAFGDQAWIPTFLHRTYGWSMAQAGWAAGLAVVISAPLGLMAGSALSEWLTRRGHDDADLRVTLLGVAGAVPAAVLFPLMPTPKLAMLVFGLQFFVNMLLPGPQSAALQIVTPNQMRGQVTALFLFVFNAIGFGFGPTFVALLTDHVFHDEALLRYSLSATAAIIGPLAALTIGWGLKPYAQSVRRARTWA